MPKNKIFNEYLENEYNKENICNMIHSKIEHSKKLKRRLVSTFASLFIITILVTTGSSIYAKKNWEKEYREYVNRQINAAKTILNTEMPENTKNLDIEYIYQDNLGIKINSLSITEYSCQMDIDFKVLNEQKKFEAFEFGFAIYDNENNIYAVNERIKFGTGKFLNYKKKLCEELGLKYNASKGIPKESTSGASLNPLSIDEDKYTMRLNLHANQSLPKSKKLYIRIFDVGYTLVEPLTKENGEIEIKNSEDFVLSDSEWQFEIEIPNKFYDRNYADLNFSENIDGITINSTMLSSEGYLAINLNTKYSIADILENTYISDEDEKIYTIYNIYDPDQIELLFKINADDVLNKKLYFNIKIDKYNIDKKIELIKK